mmetsp:Transcript_28497/g.51812  ORF Transcript_28497/g.51812 Transcript_28497/m.51812 type:complete len:281 (-) Transcript_28497:459-1301(-)
MEAAICKKVRPAAFTFSKVSVEVAAATRLKIPAVSAVKLRLWQSKCSNVMLFLGWVSATSTPCSAPGGKLSSMSCAMAVWPKAMACQRTECPDASRTMALHSPWPMNCSIAATSPTWTACHSSGDPPCCGTCSRRATPVDVARPEGWELGAAFTVSSRAVVPRAAREGVLKPASSVGKAAIADATVKVSAALSIAWLWAISGTSMLRAASVLDTSSCPKNAAKADAVAVSVAVATALSRSAPLSDSAARRRASTPRSTLLSTDCLSSFPTCCIRRQAAKS